MKPRFVVAALAAIVAVFTLAPTVASAAPASPPAHEALSLPGVRGGSNADISSFMTAVLRDVDGFWTRYYQARGLGQPSVRYQWIPAGRSVVDGCSGKPTDDTAAFYCPTDDTIYLSESFAAAVRDGKIQGWPSGGKTDAALGDMAVAYMIAHEEAHNIQGELGLASGNVPTSGIELQADCMAGAWAADAASRGAVNASDVDIAQNTAWLVGDYAFDNPGHHGTPQERQQAFMNGYHGLSSCNAYSQTT